MTQLSKLLAAHHWHWLLENKDTDCALIFYLLASESKAKQIHSISHYFSILPLKCRLNMSFRGPSNVGLLLVFIFFLSSNSLFFILHSTV